MEKKQFVQLPTDKIDNLEPKDKLIYLCLKRWDHDGIAKVPISALATQSGASAPTIRKIIKTLADNNYIKIIPGEKGDMNSYEILDYNKWEQFDYTFLDNKNLSFKEKAFMAATKQYLQKDNEIGKTTYDPTKLAGLINISPTTVYRINQSLKKKQVLVEVKTKSKDPETGCCKTEYIYDLGKMGIVPILQAHEEAIQDIQNHNAIIDKNVEYLIQEISELKKELASTKKDNRLLLNELESKNKKQINILTD